MTTQVTTGVIADGAVTVSKIAATGIPGPDTFLRGDGQWALPSASANLQSQLFTSSGSWIAPAGCSRCRVTVIGGGGGGAQNASAARIGGSGAVSVGMCNVTPGQTYTVTVGSGGTGTNTGTGATAGGNSSFGSFVTANGGQPASTSADGTNGSATSGAGYTEQRRGNMETNGAYYSATAGMAAAGFLAGPPRAANISSLSGSVFTPSGAAGAGTGGAAGTAGSSNATGGVGGAVYVEWVA